MRGLAALLVMICHLPKFSPLLDVTFIKSGILMVPLFFVLSGFVINNSYGNKLNSAESVLRFQFLRWGRLYPVHILILLLYVALTLVQGLAQSGSLFAAIDFTALWQQLLLVQAIGPTGNAFTFNAPAWSISTEFYTYLLFGLIVVCFGRFRVAVFALIAAFSLFQLAYMEDAGFRFLLHCTCGFFIGSLVSVLVQARAFPVPRFAFPLVLVVLALFLSSSLAKANEWVIYPLSALLILSIINRERDGLTRWFCSPLLTWLGAISYSLYMCHHVIIKLTSIVIKRVLHLGWLDDNYMSVPAQIPFLQGTLAVIAIIALVFVVSITMHKLVELPCRAWSRRVAFGDRFGAIASAPRKMLSQIFGYRPAAQKGSD